MLLFALLWACSDTIINEVKRPEIIVAPELLDFGHLLSGLESDTMTITISNGGSADLVVERLELEGANYSLGHQAVLLFPQPGGIKFKCHIHPQHLNTMKDT